MKFVKLAFAVLLSLSFGAPAPGQSIGTLGGNGAISNPFALPDLRPAHTNGYDVLTGKVEVLPPSSGRRILIYATGQSNIGNPDGAAAYVPTNPDRLFNLDLFNGGFYKLADPVLGPGGAGASWSTILADTLVTDGKADSVTVINIAIGNTTAANWAPGGITYPRIAPAVATVASKSNYTPTLCIILRDQGESDTLAGTSQGSYAASLSGEVTQWRALASNCPIFISQVSFVNNVTSAAIVAAQVAEVNGATVFSGGNLDAIGCAGRSVGCIDYNTAGNIAAAAIVKVPVEAWLDAH